MASILRVKDQNGNEIDIPAIKGASAYEIAVKNGFKGTEEEWLESLKSGGSSKPKPNLPPLNADVSKVEAYFSAQENSFAVETSLLPSNARVTKIEIPDLVNETGEYVQLEDMVSKDPNGMGCPYYIMYPKDMMGTVLTNVAAIVVFTILPNAFHELISSYAYGSETIKIYYEIEE